MDRAHGENSVTGPARILDVVHDHGSHGPGRRPDDARRGSEQTPEADQEYSWGGKPGEDFGPIAPPGPLPTPDSRPPSVPPGPRGEPARTEAPLPRSTARRPPAGDQSLRPDGVFTQRTPRRRRGPILALLAALLLGGLTAGVLFLISRQGLSGLWGQAPVAAPPPSSAPVAASPVVAVTPRPPATSPLPVASPAPASAASPTPLTTGRPSPSPAPARPAATAGTARPAPAILPTPPALVTPPGLRFPTSTPARIGPSLVSRTPPPIASPRLPNVLTRVWSEQVVHRVGDDASICAQTSSGSTAQLLVVPPDRKARTLAELATPVDRVCHTLKVDQPDLWELRLIVRDANANEIEQQVAALWVSR